MKNYRLFVSIIFIASFACYGLQAMENPETFSVAAKQFDAKQADSQEPPVQIASQDTKDTARQAAAKIKDESKENKNEIGKTAGIKSNVNFSTSYNVVMQKFQILLDFLWEALTYFADKPDSIKSSEFTSKDGVTYHYDPNRNIYYAVDGDDEITLQQLPDGRFQISLTNRSDGSVVTAQVILNKQQGYF